MNNNPILDIPKTGVNIVDQLYFREWNSLGNMVEHDHGYLLNKIPSKVLSQIDKDIDYLIKDPNKIRVNEKLAGQITNELQYPESPIVEDYIQSLVQKYDKRSKYITGYIKKMFSDNSKLNFTLSPFWANFQKKSEYNPMHTHSGVLSFVIWYKTPYLYKDEVEYDTAKKGSSLCTNGLFSFIINKNGVVDSVYMPVDKNWDGYISLFPADLFHQVYPFFTSDDYRISISGNIMLQS